MADDLETLPGQRQLANPLMLLQSAIDKGMDVEKLGKLMDLAERWQTGQAAIAFAEAIKQFQALMPPVVKGNPVKNKAGELLYMWADYDDIMELAQPHLDTCGIVITFDTELIGTAAMKTTCHVRVGTHVEHTNITLAIPGIPNANDAQRAGGALSYGQRYSIKAALNIRVKGDDNDARALRPGLTEPQTVELNNLIERCRAAGRTEKSMQSMWDWLFTEPSTTKRMPEMKATDFARTKEELENWIKKYEGKK